MVRAHHFGSASGMATRGGRALSSGALEASELTVHNTTTLPWSLLESLVSGTVLCNTPRRMSSC